MAAFNRDRNVFSGFTYPKTLDFDACSTKPQKGGKEGSFKKEESTSSSPSPEDVIEVKLRAKRRRMAADQAANKSSERSLSSSTLVRPAESSPCTDSPTPQATDSSKYYDPTYQPPGQITVKSQEENDEEEEVEFSLFSSVQKIRPR